MTDHEARPPGEQSTGSSAGEELKTVASAGSEFEAHALVAVLEEAGIPAFAFGFVRQAIPVDIKFARVPVQVRGDDLERARTVLAANKSDSVDIDWDEVDVGEREDNLPLSSERSLPGGWRIVLAVGALILFVVLFKTMVEILGSP